jgi:endonuclease YncB( thermonuclease family)
VKILLLAAALLISGPAVVLDGDTVVVTGVHIRLKGVDAPELGNPLGEAARQVMVDIIGDSELTCRLTGERTWRREVGYCTTADGIDINRAIIEQGAALSCPRFDPRYLPFEQPAALAAQPRASYCLPRR